MFVDLMHDLANTFTERFLKAQLVFEQAPAPVQPPPPDPRSFESRPTKRFNAMGILEDIPDEEPVATADVEVDTENEETSAPRPVAVGTPAVVGAGSVRSLAAGGGSLPGGWENTPRNNACPCGSGKKFKKCHGANL